MGVETLDESSAAVEVTVKTEQKKISWAFFYYNVGVFFCWSAYVALFNLQSSINVEDALGTTTGATVFSVSVFSGIFLAPAAMKKFGVKTCILFGDAGMFPYILANLFPRYYTLLPAGILMAFLQSPMWPSMSTMNVMFASRYSNVSKRTKDAHVISFSSYFFTVFQSSQVFGSLLAYVVLYGFDQTPLPESTSVVDCQNSTNFTCAESIPDYSHCGVNDCQNATIIEQSISNYKPVNRVSLYVLVAVAIFLELLACLVHAILLPSDKTFEVKLKKYEGLLLNQKEKDPTLLQNENGVQGYIENPSSSDSADETTSANAGFIRLALESARSILKHTMNLKLLLLVPITLYNGLAMAFIEAEVTRSFASCVLGVQWVGICMSLYSFWDAIFSLVYGKVGRKVGRIPMFVASLLLECGNYLNCLLWSGKPNTLFSVMLIFTGFGISDGIFQAIVNVTHIDFFPGKEAALPVWNVLLESGLVIGYAVSTLFCVRTRVYFNSVFLVTGFIGVAIADFLHRRENSERRIWRKDNLKEGENAEYENSVIT